MAIRDANFRESWRVEYRTLAPDLYLQWNHPQGFPILNPFLHHTVIIRSSTSTAISQATGESEPPDLFQWILHWNLHQNSQKSFFWSPFLSRRWHFPWKRRPSWCQEGRLHSRPNFIVPVCKISEHKRSLSHAGMPTHTLVDSAISCRSGEVASIIVIWAINQTTLFPHQIGAFDLSRLQIVQKVQDKLDLRYDVAMSGYGGVLAVTRFSLGG